MRAFCDPLALDGARLKSSDREFSPRIQVATVDYLSSCCSVPSPRCGILVDEEAKNVERANRKSFHDA